MFKFIYNLFKKRLVLTITMCKYSGVMLNNEYISLIPTTERACEKILKKYESANISNKKLVHNDLIYYLDKKCGKEYVIYRLREISPVAEISIQTKELKWVNMTWIILSFFPHIDKISIVNLKIVGTSIN